MVCQGSFHDTGPPGGKLEFGSFAGLPDPIRQAGNQSQNRPGVPQPQSGPLQPGPPQQQQQRLDRRTSGSGPRSNNGYKQPSHYDPHAQAGPTAGMQYSGYNGVPAAAQPGYIQQQQQGYPYGHQANYYQGYQHMMMPQGSYPQGAYSGQQQQGGRTPQAPQQYRPSQPPARSQTQQQHQPTQAAAGSAPRRKKALDIIDPNTHSKVEISPRSKCTAPCAQHVVQFILRACNCRLFQQ